VKKVKVDGNEVFLTVERAHENLQELLKAVGVVKSVEVREASLNDVFLRYTGRKYREEEEGAEGGWSERAMHATAQRD